MSIQCFRTKYLITKISMFLEPNEIISFSASNKTINENLKASNNPAINNIFYNHVTKRCFETEDDDIELALFNKKIEMIY